MQPYRGEVCRCLFRCGERMRHQVCRFLRQHHEAWSKISHWIAVQWYILLTCKWIFKNTTSNRLAFFFPYSIIATRRFRTRTVIPKSSKMQPFFRPAATFLSRRSRKFLYNVRMGGGVLIFGNFNMWIKQVCFFQEGGVRTPTPYRSVHVFKANE